MYAKLSFLSSTLALTSVFWKSCGIAGLDRRKNYLSGLNWLPRLSQIYEEATALELEELLPRFVENIIWTPTEIQIALFDRELERGLLPSNVNHSSGGALEFVNWLPEQ